MPLVALLIIIIFILVIRYKIRKKISAYKSKKIQKKKKSEMAKTKVIRKNVVAEPEELLGGLINKNEHVINNESFDIEQQEQKNNSLSSFLRTKIAKVIDDGDSVNDAEYNRILLALDELEQKNIVSDLKMDKEKIQQIVSENEVEFDVFFEDAGVRCNKNCWLGWDAPYKKNENAYNSFAFAMGTTRKEVKMLTETGGNSLNGTLLFLFDDTFWGSCERGLCLTTMCIAGGDSGHRKACFLKDINEIEVSTKNQKIRAKNDQGEAIFWFKYIEADMNRNMRLICEAIQKYVNQPAIQIEKWMREYKY